MVVSLGKCFGVDAEFWPNLQSRYEIDLAHDRSAAEIYAIKSLQVA